MEYLRARREELGVVMKVEKMMLFWKYLTSLTDFARGGGHVFRAAGSGAVMAGAEGVALVTGCVMTMAVVCVMVTLILLNGTQATVTIRLRTKDQSPRKLSEFLTARPPLPTSSSSFLQLTL